MTPALSTSGIVAAWEAGLGRRPLDQAIALLWSAGAEEPEALPLAERDRRLLELRQASFGPTLALIADCPACGAASELEVEAAALAASLPSPVAEAVEADGRRIEVRALDSRDLAAAAAAAEGEVAPLLRRRLTGEPDPPEALRGRLDALIEAREAAGELSFALTCADCGAGLARSARRAGARLGRGRGRGAPAARRGGGARRGLPMVGGRDPRLERGAAARLSRAREGGMTGVLARLVARATGQAAPGLRPRPRSRFEQAAGAGFSELAFESVARAPPAAPREDLPGQPQRRPEPPSAAPFEPERRAAPPSGAAATERRPAPPPAGEPLSAPRPFARPAPAAEDRPAAPPAEVPHPAAPAGTAPPARIPPREAAAPEPAASQRRPPAPLLEPEPLAPARRLEPPANGPAARTAAPRPGAARATAAAEAPEIHIEIGRIELRLDPPRPERSARPARPRPAAPSLAAYLRGERGG